MKKATRVNSTYATNDFPIHGYGYCNNPFGAGKDVRHERAEEDNDHHNGRDKYWVMQLFHGNIKS